MGLGCSFWSLLLSLCARVWILNCTVVCSYFDSFFVVPQRLIFRWGGYSVHLLGALLRENTKTTGFFMSGHTVAASQDVFCAMFKESSRQHQQRGLPCPRCVWFCLCSLSDVLRSNVPLSSTLKTNSVIAYTLFVFRNHDWVMRIEKRNSTPPSPPPTSSPPYRTTC